MHPLARDKRRIEPVVPGVQKLTMAKEWTHHGPPKMLLVLYWFGPSIHVAQHAAATFKDSDLCCVW